MKYFLDKKSNLQLPRVAKIVRDTKNFRDTSDYQKFLKNVIRALRQVSLQTNKKSIFAKEIIRIKNGSPLTEKTSWGGVSLKNVDVEKDFIRKLLVIRKHGILGFEIHRKKLEKLRIVEGKCFVLYSNHKSKNWQKGKISLTYAAPDDRFEFLPMDEHGIIAITNCVIEETSTNHLDDLTYIFKANRVS